MSFGTLDRTPPPFFRQGPSAATRLLFFAALALFLMVADARFTVVNPLRQVLATVLLPLQSVAGLPAQWLRSGASYFEGMGAAQRAERQAREAMARQAERAQRAEQLERDNTSLRSLLALQAAVPPRSVAAEVLYEAADLYSAKWVINRGSAQGVVLGSPVINAAGVLGQVTRVYAQIAEVTLLSDKDAAIPVLVARTGQRAAAFGGAGGGLMELRFTSANADVRVGDALLTSGLDGVYPAGLAVASVLTVDRRAESAFARITLTPAAAPDGVHFVLVLEPVGAQLPARPEPPPALGVRERGASKPAPAPAQAAAAARKASQ